MVLRPAKGSDWTEPSAGENLPATNKPGMSETVGLKTTVALTPRKDGANTEALSSGSMGGAHPHVEPVSVLVAKPLDTSLALSL